MQKTKAQVQPSGRYPFLHVRAYYLQFYCPFKSGHTSLTDNTRAKCNWYILLRTKYNNKTTLASKQSIKLKEQKMQIYLSDPCKQRYSFKLPLQKTDRIRYLTVNVSYLDRQNVGEGSP